MSSPTQALDLTTPPTPPLSRSPPHVHPHARLRVLNLHCNNVETIEGLDALPSLEHLDLSSNRLARMEGLDGLPHLVTLNVASNAIVSIDGLGALRRLKKLNLSYNLIRLLAGLRAMHGDGHELTSLDLRGNEVASFDELAALSGLGSLETLRLGTNAHANPVCADPGFRAAVFAAVPRLGALDGADADGADASSATEDNLIPGMGRPYLPSAAAAAATRQEQQQPAASGGNISRLPRPTGGGAGAAGAASRPSLETPSIDRALELRRRREAATARDNFSGSSRVAPGLPLPPDEATADVTRAAAARHHRVRYMADGSSEQSVKRSKTKATEQLERWRDGDGNTAAQGAPADIASASQLGTESATGPSSSSEGTTPSSETDASSSIAIEAADPGGGWANSADYVTHKLGEELFEERIRRTRAENAALKLIDHLRREQTRSEQDDARYRQTAETVSMLKSALQDSESRNGQLLTDVAAGERAGVELAERLKEAHRQHVDLQTQSDRTGVDIAAKAARIADLEAQLGRPNQAAQDKIRSLEVKLAATTNEMDLCKGVKAPASLLAVTRESPLR